MLGLLAKSSALVLNAPALRGGLRLAPAAARCMSTMEEASMQGTCKWFNVEKGYGFIAVTGEDRDVFVHQSDIYAPGFRSLQEGEPLEFRLATDDKTGKLKAVDVTGPEGAYVQGAPRQMQNDDDYY